MENYGNMKTENVVLNAVGICGALCMAVFASGVSPVEDAFAIGSEAEKLGIIGVLAVLSTLSMLGNIWLIRRGLLDVEHRDAKMISLIEKVTQSVDQLNTMKRDSR